MSPQPRAPGSALTGIVTIVLTLLGWSSIPLFLKSFIGEIDAWTANGWRYAFSALLWAPVIVWAYAKGRWPKGLWVAAIVPSIFNTLGQIGFAEAPYHIDVSLMTFALRLQIVFVTVGAAILFASERRIVKSPGFIAGLALVFGGTVYMIAVDPKLKWSATGLGVALSVGSGLFYACYSLSVRRFMHGVNPLIAFAAISIYTAVGILIPMFVFGADHGARAWHLPYDRFAVLLLSSLIGIGLGHTFYYISIARLGVAVSAGVIQLQPFIVAVASTFRPPPFTEHLTAGQWIGGCVAIAGSALILLVQHRLSRPAANTDEFSTLPLDADTAAAEAAADRPT